jgi:membrane protease YdiL (CAAX protease family)
MKEYIQNRLKEPSTWLGLLQFSIAFGFVHFSPEQTDATIYIIMLIAGSGLTGIVTPDKQHNDSRI